MATDTLRDHWGEAPEWDGGKRLWALYLTFPDQIALNARILRDQQALRELGGLTAISLPSIHLTMQGIAFQHTVSESTVLRITERVAGALEEHPVPTLLAMPAEAVRDAVCFPVRPAAELTGLREMIRAVAADEIGEERLYRLPEPPGGFDPHISIAYAHSFVPAADLGRAMAGTERTPTPFEAAHLSLIDLTRGNRSWTWTRERRLPLRSSSAVRSGS
ncbi:hypothetical protein KIH74_19590 [Kineosporia sp. J2-2]|uniref:2'-5' RNA ligase n=1 Tax=Kineosporia corallincola TaxID=2835133 RepID=A0ABS5TJ71_9ACTN|nr:2'-5' RNA ligase family protein [Kineosporia corallincola]MBT0771153.1 hypothetical protein [Kineosporia corallincola]